MAETAVPTVTTDELRMLLDDASLPCWLIHATDAVPFRVAHLPGALARPDDALLHRLDDGTQVVVYGEDEDARDARNLASRLARRGVEVAWYAGGLAAWSAAGSPVEGSR